MKPATVAVLLLLANANPQLMETVSDKIAPDAKATAVESAAPRTVTLLAKNLNISHVRNSSYHLSDPDSYNHGKQKRLIQALSR